jgi:hypothetical protein
MKRFWIKQVFTVLVCSVVALGLAGCEDDDPPDNISGTWACSFYSEESESLEESWTFAQSGQTVSGSYTFDGRVWPFSGSYVDGEFNGVDADNWILRLEFEEDEASGTISGDGEVWTANLSR